MRPWVKFILMHIEFNSYGTVRNLGDSIRLAKWLWPGESERIREDLGEVLVMSQLRAV